MSDFRSSSISAIVEESIPLKRSESLRESSGRTRESETTASCEGDQQSRTINATMLQRFVSRRSDA